MPLVCICSPKGGVGKTTIAANLAWSLVRTGNKVLAIDFDRQNALRLHFSLPISDGRGFVVTALENSDWSQAILTLGGNLFVMPYGEVTPQQQHRFEEKLFNDDHFLLRGLQTVLNYPGLIIIADFPPGSGAALTAVTTLADLHLVVMLADTASLSLLPSIENNLLTGGALNHHLGYYFVLNQYDLRQRVNRDVTEFMQAHAQGKVIGTIHRDECVVEANASQCAVYDFSSSSAAAFDLELLATAVTQLLQIKPGDVAVRGADRIGPNNTTHQVM